MRKIVALTGLLLSLAAAKPVPPEDGAADTPEAAPEAPSAATREAWRNQGVPVCVARLRPLRSLTPDDLEAICGCTFDSYLEGHGTNPLPGLESDRIPVAMEQPLLNCTGRIRPEERDAVRQLGAIWPAGSPMIAGDASADNSKPINEADAGPPAESGGDDGGGFWDWLRSLRLPDWLTGASALLWVALGILVFGLLVLKIRRRDPRNDLMGPPSSMRRGAPPQQPRRPDLPR